MLDRHDLKRLADAFKTDINRFSMHCPDCKQGCNSEQLGGNERCFHCDACGLIECLVTSPEIDSITENGEGQ